MSVAIDGTKLPLFVIYKEEHGKRVEKSLPHCVSDRIFAAVQKEA